MKRKSNLVYLFLLIIIVSIVLVGCESSNDFKDKEKKDKDKVLSLDPLLMRMGKKRRKKFGLMVNLQN